MHKALIAIALMPFLSGCPKPIKVGAPPPPAEMLVCQEEPVAPDLEPLVATTAANGAQVYSKSDVDARDAEIADYIVNYRGAWFSCSSNLEWNRNYWD